MSLKAELTELYDRCILAGEVSKEDAVNLIDNFWGDIQKNMQIQEMYAADPGLAAKGRCVSALIAYEIRLLEDEKARRVREGRLAKVAPTGKDN